MQCNSPMQTLMSLVGKVLKNHHVGQNIINIDAYSRGSSLVDFSYIINPLLIIPVSSHVLISLTVFMYYYAEKKIENESRCFCCLEGKIKL